MDAGSEDQSSRVARYAGWALGISLFILFMANPFGMPDKAAAVAAVSALMACFWITLCLPIPVTSLLPVALFPILGIMSSRETVKFYADDTIYLFMGGFIIALALEKWGFQKRAALHIARLAGTSPSRLVLGFFAATAAISMFISNTATAMMMFPIALAVARQSAATTGKDDANFAIGLMLAVAYGASIGGIGTPIGTPPNIVFLGQFKEAFPDAPRITFFDWGKAFIPLAIIFVVIAWLVVVKLVAPPLRGVAAGREAIMAELRLLGPMRPPERRVALIFGAAALLWIFRQPINLGAVTIPGWSAICGEPEFLSDATVAIALAVALFVVPAGLIGSNQDNPVSQGSEDVESQMSIRRRVFLMDWQTAARLPWGILLLFGGGFAIAGGFKESGLDVLLGEAVKPLLQVHPLVVVALVCLLLTFMTELASNTATTAAMLPVMIGTARGLGLNPLLLMIPATIAASFGFMLPVGTPPNAIVFSSGYVPMRKMVRAGLILDLISVIMVTVWIYFVVLPMWGQPLIAPAWAIDVATPH